jgi:hypothetical protein
MLPSPLPESNYYVEFIKADSSSDTYASKTKLRPLSGIRSSLRRSILLQDLTLPSKIFSLEPVLGHLFANEVVLEVRPDMKHPILFINKKIVGQAKTTTK